MLVGVVALAATGLGVRSLLNVGAVALLLLVGVGLIAMPWIAGLYRELTVERQERCVRRLAPNSRRSARLGPADIDAHPPAPTTRSKSHAWPEPRNGTCGLALYEPARDPQMRLSAAFLERGGRTDRVTPGDRGVGLCWGVGVG